MAGKSVGARAFTTFEFLMVLILALLVLASLPRPSCGCGSRSQSLNAKITATNGDLSVIADALRKFQKDCGRYPSDDEGLEALVTNLSGPGWKGPYIKQRFPDPWGSQYLYKSPGPGATDVPRLYSFGPDKREGKDDIESIDFLRPPPTPAVIHASGQSEN